MQVAGRHACHNKDTEHDRRNPDKTDIDQRKTTQLRCVLLAWSPQTYDLCRIQYSI